MSYVFKEHEAPPPWKEFKKRAPMPFLVPLFYLNWLADWGACLLSKWSLLELLEYLGSFSILFAVIFYFAGASDRLKEKHYQAWQVINSAQGKGGNGGRIDALQELNDDHVPLIGVDVSDAYLQGVRLGGAELRRGNFSAADLRGADFRKADLEDSEFHFANLRGADLSQSRLAGSILEEADLTGAVLVGADLSHLSFEGADLSGADLENIQNWRDIKSMTNANIMNVQRPPEGFIAWAKKMGATN